MSLEIFAGPIVRKVTINEVYLWLATIGTPDIEVKLFINSNIIGSGISKSISIRDKLYIHLVKITPIDRQFPSNKIINYSIGIPSGNGYDYQEFEKIVINDKLAFDNESWYSFEGLAQNLVDNKLPNFPSFIIQSQNTKLNIAFGSCRKPHDKGEDAFIKIDSLLRNTYLDITKRPSVLFLGGDQIYADDVEKKYVFPALIKLSKQLNIIEQLPNSATHTISYSDRTKIVKDMGFTSSETKTHLLSLGEFIAMYGLVWNPNNWKNFDRGIPVTDFLQGLGSVRRVLANISIYMMFDDHDVTDDWFITNKWKNDVLYNDNGKRVIANAMAAYFLFQGWGNNPDKFHFPEVKKIIEDHVNVGSDKKIKSPFDVYFLNKEWEFFAPTNPPTYFLNTRTERDGKVFPSILKSKKSWDKTKINIQNKNFPFVLITAGPLVTFPGIDDAQTKAATYPEGKYTGKHGSDYESWFANKENYKLFFEHFKNNTISKIIILSGDVHYSFSAIFSIYNKEKLLKKSGGYEIKCLQITSSALNNNAGDLWRFATVPYTGKLYLLIFMDTFEITCDRQQAEAKVLLNRRERIIEGSARTTFPNYSLFNDEIYELNITGPLPSDFIFKKLDEEKYPQLIIELKINSLSPKTIKYLGEHNYGFVSVNQNNVEYSFNNGQSYFYTL